MGLTVVGVRHHSPACARLVAHVIETLRPRFVLIEGPSDYNARLDELALAHRLPIAIYTYRLGGDGRRARGTWSPFCDYSPEWIAARRGAAVGADVLFIDLPAWDDAFAETENRYSDLHLNVSERLSEIAARLGFDSVDTLWDHLFEQPKPVEVLERELATYFDVLREGEEAGPRDDAREGWMARWIAWAMAERRDDEEVVVVCGGYHAPALRRLWTAAETARPELVAPADRVGSYLVPFSFHRLDAFSGYAAGMPSPAFYQESWERGEACAETMLYRAAARLREKGQRVSTADVIAANELARGLADLRGHLVPARADVLDGLAGALLKDALDCPAPWTTRAVLAPGTDPMLVEIVAAFSGDARGELDPATPRPPLVADVERALDEVGLALDDTARTIRLDPRDPATSAQRTVLHRLLVLEIPGVELVAVPDLRRGSNEVFEGWRLRRLLETEPALIERAVYGATLEQAALAKVLEVLASADGVVVLAQALERALLAGYRDVAAELAERAAHAVDREPILAHLGAALARFASIARADATPAFVALIARAVERALWLLEGVDGAHAAFSKPDVLAVAAIRDALEHAPPPAQTTAREVFARRASAAEAPPAIRGACLGALWSRAATGIADDAARTTTSIPADALGNFLSGLFLLAREELLDSSLLDAVDARLTDLAGTEFLIALPSLRRAFSFFPPRERLAIAKRLVRAHGGGAEARALLEPSLSTVTIQAGARLDAEVFRAGERFGLLGRSVVSDLPPLVRWRLVLGGASAEALDDACAPTAEDLACDAALGWLYERDGSLDERDIRRSCDLGGSQLSVPAWINEIHRLFPKETVERLERDAVEEFAIHEVVTNAEVLARIEPSETLLRAVLLTKHLMSQEVLGLARELVRKVVRALMENLARTTRRAFAGARARHRSRHKRAQNFDPKGTLRKNLATYDLAERRLYIREPLFHSRTRRQNERWQIVILVDESGSMVGSVIHAAVTAACFWGLPSIKTHLVIFDTAVVDLTASVSDPVETLMKVQLGGGTDIARAVAYGETLVENPRRTIVVLVTDLFEGGDADALVRPSVKRLCDQGVRFLALAALDERAEPVYDKDLGRRLVRVGAHVGAMTPAELVAFLKDVLG